MILMLKSADEIGFGFGSFKGTSSVSMTPVMVNVIQQVYKGMVNYCLMA
jgi:hypothetical protein